MKYSYSLVGESGGAAVSDYKIGADILQESVVMRDDTPGEVINATTTSATNAFGVSQNISTSTYSTTQGTGSSSAEVLVETVYGPMSVFIARGNPGATSGTAYADGDTNVLTNTTASTTGLIVTDSDVGTASMAGGEIFGISGANAGQSRLVTTHNNSTDVRVTVPFNFTIAVGDRFLVLPFSKGEPNVQLTSAFNEVDTLIVNGTGAELTVVKNKVHTGPPNSDSVPEVEVYFVFEDHVWNIGD
jgi:hypothetical protein